MDKPARVTLFDKMKRLFSKSGGMKNEKETIVEDNPGNKRLIDEAIERHRTFLEDHIDPDFGLLEKLLAHRILSSRETSEVKDKSPFYKRNSQLLDYILEKHQGDRLIEALQNTEQIHIANYLNGNGEYNSAYGAEWPLTEREISILDFNEESLIELLDLCDLLGRLYSAKVINRRQMNFISSKPNSDSKTEALLDILRRRSKRDYQQIINCLRQSNQRHIAKVLESGGVVVRVHANLDGPLENVTSAEDEIVARFTSALSGSSIAESSRILERVQLNIFAAKKGQSIVLYIWCETVEELLRLHDLLTSGRLKDAVEQLFNQLLTRSQNAVFFKVKNITISDEEFRHMKAYFAVDAIQEPTSETTEAEPDETKKEQKQGTELPSSLTPKTYYLIKSHLSGRVLDVQFSSRSPGTSVITWPSKNWRAWNNQLWYDDPMTGTIRSKATDHCLDLSGNSLVVNPYDPKNPNQQWERHGTVIRNSQTPHRVIDVAEGSKTVGAGVISNDQNGSTEQQFEFVFVPGLTRPYTSKREFFIVSEMHNNVLAISEGNPDAGAAVIVCPKQSPVVKNQLWYFDQNGVIFSAFNNMVLESQDHTQAQVMPFRNHSYQQWTVAGNQIISETGMCLTIQDGQHKDGAAVQSYEYSGSSNQHWVLEFVKKGDKEQLCNNFAE